MTHQNLKCPNCDSMILASDINLNTGLAKCASCNVIFDFKTKGRGPQLDNTGGSHPAEVVRKEEIFVIPKGIQVLKMMSELEIDVRWRDTTSWFLMIFALFWNAILLPMALMIIMSGEYFFLLFMSLHIGVGVGLLYWVMAKLFNTTYINVDSRYITVEHRPFSLFFKEHQIPIHEVEQLYVEKYSNGSTNGRPNYVYAVRVKKKNYEEVRLVKGIGKVVQARYIEQEIERFAGIPDRPVSGELGR